MLKLSSNLELLLSANYHIVTCSDIKLLLAVHGQRTRNRMDKRK